MPKSADAIVVGLATINGGETAAVGVGADLDKQYESAYGRGVMAMATALGASASADSVTVLPALEGSRLVVVGLEDADVTPERLRRATGNALRSIAAMEGAGIACCKIRTTDEVVADENLWERGTLVEVETPPSFREHRTVKRRGTWIYMSKTPAVQKRAPDLGEDNYFYLTQYGLPREEIDELQAKWATKFKKQ